MLYGAGQYGSLAEALEGVSFAVAMTRWAPGSQGPLKLPDVPSLLVHPEVQRALQQQPPSSAVAGSDLGYSDPGSSPTSSGSQAMGTPSSSGGSSSRPPPARVALVFGREDLGLDDEEEVALCDAACSIPIGRLQVRLRPLGCVAAGACICAGVCRPSPHPAILPQHACTAGPRRRV